MALCSDAVLRDGDVVGDPTEGALVVLAEKGGIDVAALRRQRPAPAGDPVRLRLQVHGDLPRWTDDDGRRRGPVLRQGRPGCAGRRAPTATWAGADPSPFDDAAQDRYEPRRTRSWPSRACGCWPSARRTSPPRTSDAGRRPEGPARPAGPGRPRRASSTRRARRRATAIAGVPRRRHPGADDHRRPRRDGRAPSPASSGIPGAGGHRRRPRRDRRRRRARPPARRHRRGRPGVARAQAPHRARAAGPRRRGRDDRRRGQRRTRAAQGRHRRRDGGRPARR